MAFFVWGKPVAKSGRPKGSGIKPAVIAKIVRLKAEGYSVAWIAEHFKISRQTIYNLLKGKGK